MPQVLKTREDDPDARDVVGAGYAGAYGRGGIVVAEAAARGFPEFVETDGFGRPVLDETTNQPKPLRGKALQAAVEDLADRAGLVVENVKDASSAAMAKELGAAPDRPPAEEVAVAVYEQAAGVAEPDPEPLSVSEPAQPPAEAPEKEEN